MATRLLSGAVLAATLFALGNASCTRSDVVFTGGCSLVVSTNPYLAIHWLPYAASQPTVQLGVESSPASYSAVSFGGSSGMSGSYVIAGSSGGVGTYYADGYVTPSATTDVTISNASSKTVSGHMVWSATVTRNIPNAPSKSLAENQGNSFWVALGPSSSVTGLAAGRHVFATYAGSINFNADAASTPTPAPDPAPTPAATPSSTVAPGSSPTTRSTLASTAGPTSTSTATPGPSPLASPTSTPTATATATPLATPSVPAPTSQGMDGGRDHMPPFLTPAPSTPAASPTSSAGPCGFSAVSTLSGFACMRSLGGGLTVHWSDAAKARADPQGTIKMAVQGPVASYLAFGWSSSGNMVPGYAVIGTSSGSVAAYQMTDYSSSGVTQTGQFAAQGGAVTTTGGTMTVEFTLATANVPVLNISGANDVLWAVGPPARRRHLSQGQLPQHVNMGRVSMLFEGNDLAGHGGKLPMSRNGRIILIHAFLVGPAFSVLITGGFVMLTARGLRPGPSRAFFFNVHRAVQALASCLAVAGVIYVAVQPPKYKGPMTQAHIALGIALVAAAVLQVGSGFLRPPIPADYDNKGPWPKPSHRARIAFEIGHRSLGWLTVGGGVAECALGIIIVQRNGNDALPYVRPGIIACLAFAFFLGGVVLCLRKDLVMFFDAPHGQPPMQRPVQHRNTHQDRAALDAARRMAGPRSPGPSANAGMRATPAADWDAPSPVVVGQPVDPPPSAPVHRHSHREGRGEQSPPPSNTRTRRDVRDGVWRNVVHV